MKRGVLLLVLIGMVLSLAVAPAPAAAEADVKVNISVRISPVFVGLPMPATCVALPKAKKHYDVSWTEYRVAHSIPMLISFYKLQMPKHQWTALIIGRTGMTWTQGNRKIEMMFWRAPGGYTIIAVRQGKWAPPGQLKQGGKKGKDK